MDRRIEYVERYVENGEIITEDEVELDNVEEESKLGNSMELQIH